MAAPAPRCVCMRTRDEDAAAKRSKPQPVQTILQPGSMEWFEAEEEGLNHQVVSFKSPADTPAMPGMLRKSTAFGCRGTRSSNPFPSSAESAANLNQGIR
jgi:hypothetical protein